GWNPRARVRFPGHPTKKAVRRTLECRMKRYLIVALLAFALGACSLPPSVTPSSPRTIDAAPATTVTPTLPPQGVYNSCETDTALKSLCEPEDKTIAHEGFKWEIDYIGLM